MDIYFFELSYCQLNLLIIFIFDITPVVKNVLHIVCLLLTLDAMVELANL